MIYICYWPLAEVRYVLYRLVNRLHNDLHLLLALSWDQVCIVQNWSIDLIMMYSTFVIGPKLRSGMYCTEQVNIFNNDSHLLFALRWGQICIVHNRSMDSLMIHICYWPLAEVRYVLYRLVNRLHNDLHLLLALS